MKASNKPFATLSRTWMGVECRYNPIEKEYIALVFAVQMMRHYLVGQTIHVIYRVNHLRILMTKSGSLNSRLINWVKLLSQYDMTFIPQNAIKGQALADFWQPIQFQKLQNCMKTFQTRSSKPTWPQMMRYGKSSLTVHQERAQRQNNRQGGLVFVSLYNHVLARAFSLTKPCSNNVTEYNALLIGL